MKTWILAAGLLAIVPVSNAMLWLDPPPAQAVTSRWHVEHERLVEAAAREQIESERAAAADRTSAGMVSVWEWW